MKLIFPRNMLLEFSILSHAKVIDCHVFSEGIKKVWVNGNLTYDNGEISKIRSGSFLKL